MSNTLLGIRLKNESKSDILEKIKKCVKNQQNFLHIVSLNPENLVVAQRNKEFKRVIKTSQIKIIDGVGIVFACRLLGLVCGERLTGVDLMKELINLAENLCLRVLFIGGKGNLAKSLADCYQKKYPQAKFFGLEGIKDIKKPKKEEEKKVFTIVFDFKPHLIFVAFGSPDQELWIERHKDKFRNSVVMGVGGAFDFLSGKVKRAPKIVRFLGFEWLFRLLIQPWRWRRQLRLIEFLILVLKEKFINNER